MSVILFLLWGSTPDMGEGERAGRSPDHLQVSGHCSLTSEGQLVGKLGALPVFFYRGGGIAKVQRRTFKKNVIFPAWGRKVNKKNKSQTH